MPEKKKRTSRQTPRKPEKDLRITPRDKLIFEHLMTQVYASSDDLNALVGGERTNFIARLHDLTACGYLELPAQQFRTIYANRNYLIYRIGPKGIEYLRECGNMSNPPKAHGLFFGHDVIASRVLASITYGAKQAGAHFLSYGDIIADDAFPTKTLKSAERWIIPAVEYRTPKGKIETKDVEGDTRFFGIDRNFDKDDEALFFSRGIEADGNTENLYRLESEGSSLYEKLATDLTIINKKLCDKYFAFPVAHSLYVFSRYQRMERVMKEFEKITNGKGSPYVLFSHFPRFDDPQRWPKITGHMTENWQRVGGPPFNLLTSRLVHHH